MPRFNRYLFAACTFVATFTFGQEIKLVRDLDARGRVTLTKDDLNQLLPNAKMSRVSPKGSTQLWKNNPDGSFVISSQNNDVPGYNGTAPGKWHLSEDGRYCVLIEWRSVPTEEWCRYILKVGDEYYATKSDKSGDEKVYKLNISK